MDSEWIILHLFVLHGQYIIVHSQSSTFQINLLVLHQRYIIVGNLVLSQLYEYWQAPSLDIATNFAFSGGSTNLMYYWCSINKLLGKWRLYICEYLSINTRNRYGITKIFFNSLLNHFVGTNCFLMSTVCKIRCILDLLKYSAIHSNVECTNLLLFICFNYQYLRFNCFNETTIA